MRFLIDNQLPLQVVAWLTSNGHDAEHVRDLGLEQSKDGAIWRRAAELQAVIITKDEDFANYVRRGRAGPAVLWIRTGNGTTRDLLRFLAPVFQAAVRRLEAGERLVEIR